uniref:Leucine rich repeat containing 46 n=1 Tax=Anas platyrhynchos TaxID=8839 RepID=A0A8B9R279_ANAPL
TGGAPLWHRAQPPAGLCPPQGPLTGRSLRSCPVPPVPPPLPPAVAVARPGAELSGLQGVHSLGLQRNRIEKIENLCCFPNLRSLSLAGNRIRRVQNLRPLQQLRSLDLSQNLIRDLPCSLRLLDLTGNACTRQPGYRELVVGALPHLLQLDTRPLCGCTDPAPGEEEEEEEEEGSPSSEDDEELFFEPGAPFTADKGAGAEAGHSLCGVTLSPGISLQTFTRSWPGAPGGGGGRPWRNTGAAWRTGTEPCQAPSPGVGGTALAPGPRQAQPRPHVKQGARPRPPPGAGQAAPPQRGPARGDKRQGSKEAGSSPRSWPRRSSSGD